MISLWGCNFWTGGLAYDSPFRMSSEISSSKIKIIQLNFGNVQVAATGHFIKLLIEKLNSSILYLIIHASLLETTAGKANVMTSYPYGR